ncbi:MAG TPA: VWA domain-containing protein [Pseudonocardia sp.]|uniref:vWA domain-containing protein n=1 Tax=Pseudonocardia sp. TaxID=60912 RepID=UPI002F41A39D
MAPAEPDLAVLVARFAALLHEAGLPVGPDRAQRLAGAVLAVRPVTTRQLYWCALATLTTDPSQREILDPVFQAVFEGVLDPAEQRGEEPSVSSPPPPNGKPHRAQQAASEPAAGALSSASESSRPESDPRDLLSPAIASAAERLGGRDFADLSPAELAELAAAMRLFRLATPPRRTRRTRRCGHGRLVDLRDTLRAARRTGGDPTRLSRRRRRTRPRRLVVLCDISGSMEPYARALLQLLYCATGSTGAEVFTFATRLTRLTAALVRSQPSVALAEASRRAPDWSGGTRIGASVKEFLDCHGHRGMARGAVILIVSDGWETGDPVLLGEQMARLRRLAHRIVWANPRTQHESYRPLVGGMAAAWPYCDAVVSAHRLNAVHALLEALCGATAAAGSGSRCRR